MIHLRCITDDRGDTVDYAWFCSQGCYSQSLRDDPPTVTFEEGGAYPCGAEHDTPDFCAVCGTPVGNPLTDEGYADVREWLADLPFRLDPTGTLADRAADLRRTYAL